MIINKKDIQMKISFYEKRISHCKIQLRKGSSNPSKLRNDVIDYKVQIKNLEKLMEVC
jgi:flagellar biosynthesis chaperone FliJ